MLKILITFIFFPVLLFAAQGKAPFPKLLREVDEKYKKSRTLEADFTQENIILALKRREKSSGRIAFKRPDKVRWHTLKPDESLLVSNGSKSWYYTPPFSEDDKGQVTEGKASGLNSRFANALLSGSFSTGNVQKLEKTGKSTFLVMPKQRTAGTVSKAWIDIDPVKKIITKVIMEHNDGNRTEILLTNIKLGVGLEDGMFNFTMPPNTEVVVK